MDDDLRQRQPLPPPPPPSHDPISPPLNTDANQESLPVPSSSSQRRPPQITTPKPERRRPSRPQDAIEQPPTDAQAGRYYLLSSAHSGVSVCLFLWSSYSLVRYSIAITDHRDDAQRRRYAIAFTIFTAIALPIFSFNFSRALRLPPRHHIVQQVILFVGSLSLLTPTLFNLAFVSLWHRRSPVSSTMSLVGQCHWDVDVVWGGRSGQCEGHSARWGGWLAGAIARFIVTLLFLLACHWLTWLLGSDERTHSTTDPRPRSQSTAALMNSNRTRTGGRPSQPIAFNTDSASSSQAHRRTFSSSNTAQAQSPSSLSHVPHHLPKPAMSPTSLGKSPSRRYDEAAPRPSGSSNSHDPIGRLSPTSDISEYHSDVDDGGDLNRFAANFRTLVERVSKETEDGSRLPAPIYNLARPPMINRGNTPSTPYVPRRSPSPRNSSSRRSSLAQESNGAGPSSPPPTQQQSSASQANEVDSHVQMQHDLLQAHRLMLLEQAMRADTYEHVMVLGGAVRRMSTIASVADPSERGEPPWTPTSGASSYVTPRELTRSPTSSTARSGRRNPMSRHAITPPPGNGGPLTDSLVSERSHYTD